MRRSDSRVTFRFSGNDSTTRDHAAGVVDQPGIVGGRRERGGVPLQRAPQDVRLEDLRASGSPTATTGRASAARARPARPPSPCPSSAPPRWRRRCLARSPRCSARRARASPTAARRRAPRRSSASGAAAERVADGRRARLAAADAIGALVVARRRRHHHPVADGSEHVEAPLDQRSAGTNDERLGPVGTKAFAAAAGGNDPDDGHISVSYAVAGAPLRLACASAISSSR